MNKSFIYEHEYELYRNCLSEKKRYLKFMTTSHQPRRGKPKSIRVQ